MQLDIFKEMILTLGFPNSYSLRTQFFFFNKLTFSLSSHFLDNSTKTSLTLGFNFYYEIETCTFMYPITGSTLLQKFLTLFSCS